MIYLFDFDGTLVDSMPTFSSIMLNILDEYGVCRLPISPIAAYMKLWLYGAKESMLSSRGGDLFK